jgi:hypothetical protein
MKLHRYVVALAFVVACSSGDNPKSVDAPGMTGDAAPKCTGLLYDSCNPAAPNCMNGAMCKTYPMPAPGFSVCTTTCPGGTCPMQGTASVMCNGMAICKPAGPNPGCSP